MRPLRRDVRATLVGFAIACVLSGAFALRHLDRPGIYYDEVIQAVPAAAFLRGEAPSPIPGRTSTRWLGRWLPTMTQPYMGALKSQALIAPFAVFGATPVTLRVTTWVWTLCGVLFAMLWACEVLGAPTAIVAGVLLALDPSVLFVGRHDWGSFALGFACRGAGLYLLTSGWRRDAGGRLALGGACLGLGLYNKIDFGVFLAAAALGLVVAAPRVVRDAVRSRPRRAALALAGLAVGAAPALASLPRAWAAGRAFAARGALDASEWGEKAVAFATTLDGSYFQRLMLAGGRFDLLGEVQGASWGPLPWLVAASAVFLIVRLVRARSADGRDAARRFVVATFLATAAGILLTPNAARIHHVLNLVPFPQLLCAVALVELWRLGATRRALRALAAGLAALALLGSARLDARTLATLVETGGKGRWSDALDRFAAGLPPASVVVALDWGFAEPLRFLVPEQPVVESVWKLRGRRPELRLDGTPTHVYLLYPERYAVFGYGAEFLEALRALPAGAVEIEPHADRSGETAFLAVRIAEPHRLDYRRKLEVRLR